MKSHLATWSEEIILALKTAKLHRDFFSELRQFSKVEIEKFLVTDAQKLTFWINVYNASILSLLHSNPNLYERKSRFFDAKSIFFSDFVLSLNDIEHGILRCGRYKYSLGYFNDPIQKRKFRNLRPSVFDARIHFALNCGANSCPSIANYTEEIIYQQLALAEMVFLSHSRFDEKNNSLTVSEVFSWFRGDFSGKKGIILLHKNRGLIPQESPVRLIFERWNWNMNLNKFSDYSP